MDFTLKELLDVPKLRDLLDAMDEVHSMPSAIVDIEGNILTATAWQDICTKFHRVNPETEMKCRESDTHIKAGLETTLRHTVYRCPMGLIDAAMPVVVEGHHIGNVFTGQFFVEPPAEEFFIKQARQYGFDEDEYLAAMRKVPLYSEEKFVKNLALIHKLTHMLAEKGLQYKKQCEAERSLAEREDRYENLFARAEEGILILSPDGRLLEINESFARMHGYTPEEMQQMELDDLDTPEAARLVPERIQRILSGEALCFEVEHYHKDGHVFPLEVSASIIAYGGGGLIQCFHRDITERKRVESALHNSEIRFRALFDYSPIAIGIGVVQSGQLVEVNPAWLRLFGYERNEVIGRTIEELSLFYSAEERDEIISIIKQRERIVNHPVQLRNKSGALVDIQYSAEIITFDGVPCLQVMMTDVTETKRVEKALQESEYFFKESQRAANIGSYSADFCNNSWSSSDVLDAIFGIDRNYDRSVPGWLAIIHPDDREMMRQYLEEEVIAKRTPFAREYRIIRKNDGEVRWVNGLGEAKFDSQGNVVSLHGTIQDITERKRSELAVEASKEMYRALTELTSDYFFKCSRTGSAPFRVQWIDGSVSAISGYSAQEIHDAGCWLPLVHPDDRQDVASYLFSFKPGDYKQKEFRIISKDGRERWISETSRCVVGDKEGELVLYGAAKDISERKRLEEERVMLEQQFQQAQKLESLGVLAGGIAHDFNNLLAVIIGHCSLAKLKPAAALDCIQPIETAAERAAGLCQQMLAYAGKGNVTKSQTGLAELADEMICLAGSTVSSNVTIVSDLADDIPPVTVDASQIRQIIMNLVINAAEAIGESQGEVRVSLGKRTVMAEQYEKDHLGVPISPGRYACLIVSDTGCGMDDETQRRIFEPFYTTKFTGRGLGMSAVLGIIKSHNGSLQVVSRPGIGTTFTVYLPIQEEEAAEMESFQRLSTSEVWKGAGTVLLVEDEEPVICVVEAMLEELGFAVIRATNGKEALELFHRNATGITLVITDIGMPVMDGYALIPELRRLSPELPIVISSGFGDKDVSSRLAHEDIAGHIGKPYTLGRIREVLQGVVDRRRSTFV